MRCRFGWVRSKLERIRQYSESTQGLQANLSKEMYRFALGVIEEADRELVHCIFQCVAVASRALRVDELAEFLAFDFTGRQTPTFREERPRTVRAVQSMCSILLSIVKADGSSTITFLHPPVKDFLKSVRPFDPRDPFPFHHLSHAVTIPAHTRAAQACLGILLHLDKDVVTRDSLPKYPLAKYAAEHWIDHVRFEDVQQDVEEGLRCLFNPSKQHLAVWVWIHDPMMPSWRRTERAERPSQPSGTPLHYAAFYGLLGIVKYLIDDRSQDVRSRGFDDESTPLHVASARRFAGIASILL